MKKYVPTVLPSEYPSIHSAKSRQYTAGCTRAIIYYFLVVVICALSHSVEKVGVRTVEKLRAIEEEEKERVKTPEECAADKACHVQVDASYDEVYRLSTFVLHHIYQRYTALIQEAITAFEASTTPVNAKEEEEVETMTVTTQEPESVEPQEEEEDVEDIEEGDTDSEDEKEDKMPASIKTWWLFRVFRKYIENHEVPTRHVFWLRVKKNWVLFLYELIYFCNHNLLDILRLINIGMMTVACGTDNFDSLLNIVLIIPLTANLKSYIAAPVIAIILGVLLFAEYALYIVPDKTRLTSWLHMDELKDQARNYLMISNVSSVYMIPNTITMFCLVIQSQLAQEAAKRAEKEPGQEMKVQSVSFAGKAAGTRTTLMNSLRTWFTLQLHNIMLVVIFLASVANENLLNMVYLVYSLYFLFYPAAIKKTNGKAIRFIKWYAFIHLAIVVLYQIPVFAEPSDCQLAGTCVPWMSLIGLTKMVYRTYKGNPTCSLDHAMATIPQTACPGPYYLDGGILSIAIINIVVNIEVRLEMECHR